MSRIRLLPEEVRHRIAAGEVVERPASVAKELVENALDAGATEIHVDVEEGGRGLLRVRDNGGGIAAEDLPLAVLQYATSKIRTVEDIFRIASLGFRGEALPSIASVSRMEIVSRPPASETGRLLRVDGGQVRGDEPAPVAPGTVVVVRDLFYNVPARRKFLKSDAAEIAALHETVLRLALGHPEAAFTLTHNGKSMLSVPRHEDAFARIAALFGPEISSLLLPVRFQASPALAVAGFLGRPPLARPNGRTLYFFLNRRWVQMASFAAVVRQGFEGLLPPRRYPVGFLYLVLAPEEVDLNVHPTKREVRFREERAVLGALHAAVASALRPPASGVKEEKGGDRAEADAPPAPGVPSAVSPSPLSRSGASSADAPSLATAAEAGVRYLRTRPGRFAPVAASPAATAMPSAVQKSVFQPGELPEGRLCRIIGQAFDSYLVVEAGEELLLIDQHALHERLIYEELRARPADGAGQRLLVPAVVELSPEELALLEEVRSDIESLGFSVEPFGERTVSIQSVPAVLRRIGAGPLLRDVLEDLAGGRGGGTRREPLLRSLACRAALKAGDRLPDAEAAHLLDRLLRERVPLTCPHGRPFAWRIARAELARRFERT